MAVLVREEGRGRGLLASKALDAGDAVILADTPLYCVPGCTAAPQQRLIRTSLSRAERSRCTSSAATSRTCCCCLRFVGDTSSQIRNLFSSSPSPFTFCGDECRSQAQRSWLALLPGPVGALACASAVRIGTELVLLAAVVMERNRASALDEPPLVDFHRACFEARGVGPRGAIAARDVRECFAVLSKSWLQVTGHELEWSRDQFSSLLGLLAMNAIEVKVPHPLVFELTELVQSRSPADRLRLAAWAPQLEQLAAQHYAQQLHGSEGTSTSECEDGSEGDVESEEEESESSSDGDEAFQISIPCRLPGEGGGEREVVLTSAMFPPSRGIALFARVATLNHSCEPNCEVVWAHSPSSAATVVTTRCVQSGEELCISYVDVRLSVQERRAALEQRYGFTCDCERCAAEGKAALLAAERKRKSPRALTRSAAVLGMPVPAANAEAVAPRRRATVAGKPGTFAASRPMRQCQRSRQS